MSKESFGCCKKCKTPFASEKESLCSNCNTRRRKQCVLCEVWLPFDSQKCKICSAPQDKSIFKQMCLKYCCSCGASILQSSEVCYSCDSPQEVEDVQSQPPPKPPDTSASQPTDQTDSLASNANFDEPAPVIEQVTPIEESNEKINNQSLVVATPSSEQETMSINVSIVESAEHTRDRDEKIGHNDKMINSKERLKQEDGQHSSKSNPQLLTSVISSSLEISGKKVDQPSDHENSSTKAASTELHNEVTQQPKLLESSTEGEQGNVQVHVSSVTCSTHSSTDAHVTLPVSADTQPREASLTGTCLSFPYHRPKEEASKQSKNELVPNNLTTTQEQNQLPILTSCSSFQPVPHFDSFPITCTASSSVTTSLHSTSAPISSTPSVPHTATPLFVPDDASVNPDQEKEKKELENEQIDSTKKISKQECTTKDIKQNNEVQPLFNTKIFGSHPKEYHDTCTSFNVNSQAHPKKPEGDSLVVAAKISSDGTSETFDSNHNATRYDTSENIDKDHQKYFTPSASPDLRIDLRKSAVRNKEPLIGNSGGLDLQEEQSAKHQREPLLDKATVCIYYWYRCIYYYDFD